MRTRTQTNILLVIACTGVVLLHLNGDMALYIGHDLGIQDIINLYHTKGLLSTLQTAFQGMTAIIGIFLINSGYGLTLSSQNDTRKIFYSRRFTKIWLYSLICGLFCAVVAYFYQGNIQYLFVFNLLPIFGFYETPRDWTTIQFWFLSLIFAYYFVFPFIVKALNTKLFLIIAIPCIGMGYLIFFGLYNTVSIYHSTIVRFPEFLFGILLAYRTDWQKIVFRARPIKIVLGLVLFCTTYLLNYIPLLSPVSHLLFSVSAYFLGIQLAGLLDKNSHVARIFNFLKRGTFTTYLIHIVVGKAALRFLSSWGTFQSLFEYSCLFRIVVVMLISTVLMAVGSMAEKWYYKALKIDFIQRVTHW